MKWTGDVPAGLEKSNPLTFAVEKGASLVAEFATPVVKTVKADGTGDYETLEDGVAAGDYPLSRHGLFIVKGISVLSEEGPSVDMGCYECGDGLLLLVK